MLKIFAILDLCHTFLSLSLSSFISFTLFLSASSFLPAELSLEYLLHALGLLSSPKSLASSTYKQEGSGI